MTITISLFDALLAVLIVVAIVLLVQLIILVRNLMPTAKSLAKVMDDTSHITDTARVGITDAQRIVSDLSGSLGDVASTVRYKKARSLRWEASQARWPILST